MFICVCLLCYGWLLRVACGELVLAFCWLVCLFVVVLLCMIGVSVNSVVLFVCVFINGYFDLELLLACLLVFLFVVYTDCVCALLIVFCCALVCCGLFACLFGFVFAVGNLFLIGWFILDLCCLLFVILVVCWFMVCLASGLIYLCFNC